MSSLRWQSVEACPDKCRDLQGAGTEEGREARREAWEAMEAAGLEAAARVEVTRAEETARAAAAKAVAVPEAAVMAVVVMAVAMVGAVAAAGKAAEAAVERTEQSRLQSAGCDRCILACWMRRETLLRRSPARTRRRIARPCSPAPR